MVVLPALLEHVPFLRNWDMFSIRFLRTSFFDEPGFLTSPGHALEHDGYPKTGSHAIRPGAGIFGIMLYGANSTPHMQSNCNDPAKLLGAVCPVGPESFHEICQWVRATA
jgi:hypothetical protein